jgi:UDP-N-acetylglucosamine diphosphorylase / glucose-1-phosphate thymidylyltransferase / UDP-N-acetylgalactosamine diphosphorylase / glucosamine-1-phosphate N-acetyltransferase / galactosamine-1-phosphate N-acetyltransferase
MVTKAVILAAGRGTRMRNLTEEMPKPMLKVPDAATGEPKPILQHILEGLMSAGIRKFCIVTGFRAEVVEGYFEDGKKLGCEITYVRQLVQDGTGKAPELAKNFVGNDAFLLTYGDILVKPDTYKEMVARFGGKHSTGGAFDGVITVTPGQDVTKGGLNFFCPEFCLQQIVEKPNSAEVERYTREGLIKPGEPVWYNAGIYIFKPVIFEFTAKLQKSPRGEYELTDAINALCKAGFKVAGLKIAGRWVDVRDPETLQQLQAES